MYTFTADPPRITSHPQDLEDVVSGVMLTAEATGTEPLSYQWQWKPALEAGKEGSKQEGWQPCNVERFPGADSSTLTIPSVQKYNEGSYSCVISNCAGTLTSNSAKLGVGKINVHILDVRHPQCTFCAFLLTADPPKVTTHPQELKNTVPAKPVNLTIQATGTDPLTYHWQWQPAEKNGGSEEWQACDREWCDGATLTIPSVQKSNEGSYHCLISNCAGSQTSNPAELSVGKNPTFCHAERLLGGELMCMCNAYWKQGGLIGMPASREFQML